MVAKRLFRLGQGLPPFCADLFPIATKLRRGAVGGAKDTAGPLPKLNARVLIETGILQRISKREGLPIVLALHVMGNPGAAQPIDEVHPVPSHECLLVRRLAARSHPE